MLIDRTHRPWLVAVGVLLALGAVSYIVYALLAIGFVVSFFVAWAVVAWFMNWVRNRGFVPFAIYRLILGAAVLVWALNGTR